jgi:hypothetical protein
MTGYLNHVNQLARDNPANSFQAPYPHLDTISGDMTKFAENTAAVQAFIDRAGILSAKGDNVIRLRPVNTAVQYCSIVRALITRFKLSLTRTSPQKMKMNRK